MKVIIVNTILREKNKLKRLTLPVSKSYCKDAIIKAVHI